MKKFNFFFFHHRFSIEMKRLSNFQRTSILSLCICTKLKNFRCNIYSFIRRTTNVTFPLMHKTKALSIKSNENLLQQYSRIIKSRHVTFFNFVYSFIKKLKLNKQQPVAVVEQIYIYTRKMFFFAAVLIISNLS